MSADPTLTAAKRPEREYARSWGLYSERRGCWLDVLFASEREARQALSVLSDGKPRP